MKGKIILSKLKEGSEDFTPEELMLKFDSMEAEITYYSEELSRLD